MVGNTRRQGEVECEIRPGKIILSITKYNEGYGSEYEKVVDVLCPFKIPGENHYCSKRATQNPGIFGSKYEKCGYVGAIL